jgi:hypothetical protein
MVFMGQEMGAETPFKFFADLQGIPLARKYFKSPEDRRKLTSAPFAESKLNWDAVNKDYLHQFKHALTLRKSLPALSHGIVQNVYSKWGCLVYELEPPPGKGNPVKILMNPWPAPREVKEGQDGSVPNPLANSPEWTVRFRTAEPVTPDRIPSGGLMVYEKTAK